MRKVLTIGKITHFFILKMSRWRERKEGKGEGERRQQALPMPSWLTYQSLESLFCKLNQEADVSSVSPFIKIIEFETSALCCPYDDDQPSPRAD